MAPKTHRVPHALSDEALVHFKSYKYSSVDKSPFSYYILRHYWNFCVELLPLWLAPNMVTLIGFLFVIGNVALLVVMDPGLTGPAQPWVCYSYALGVWIYSTMDNIDGKQARRTGTSSGLGELFDHGIDSLNCTLASLLEISALGMGPTPAGAFCALVPTLPMFFSTWETYHTHTLYLGYFNGPTEGLTIAALLMVLGGIYGPPPWDARVADFVRAGTLPAALRPLTLRDAFALAVLLIFLVGHLPSCVSNVYEARRRAGRPFLPVLLEWAPIVLFVGSLVLWLGSPYSHLLRDNHLTLLCLTLAFVFGRMTTKTILAHLTRQPYPYWTALLAPLLAAAALVNLPALGPAFPRLFSPAVELAYLRAYFVLAAVVYARWAFLVCRAICNYLGISCLTIPDARWKALEAERARERQKRKGQ